MSIFKKIFGKGRKKKNENDKKNDKENKIKVFDARRKTPLTEEIQEEKGKDLKKKTPKKEIKRIVPEEEDWEIEIVVDEEEKRTYEKTPTTRLKVDEFYAFKMVFEILKKHGMTIKEGKEEWSISKGKNVLVFGMKFGEDSLMFSVDLLELVSRKEGMVIADEISRIMGKEIKELDKEKNFEKEILFMEWKKDKKTIMLTFKRKTKDGEEKTEIDLL